MDPLERLDLLREEVVDAQRRFDRAYHDLSDKTSLLLQESARLAQQLRTVGSQWSSESKQSITSGGSDELITSIVGSGRSPSVAPSIPLVNTSGLRSCLRMPTDRSIDTAPSSRCPASCLSPRQMRMQRCDELRRSYETGILPIDFIGTAGLQVDNDMKHGYFIISSETFEFSSYAKETIVKMPKAELDYVDTCDRMGVVELMFRRGEQWLVVNHNDTKRSSTLRLLDIIVEQGMDVRRHEVWPKTLAPCVRTYVQRERVFQAQFAYEDRKASVNERMNIHSPLSTSFIKEPESPIDQALGMSATMSTPRPFVSPLTIPSVARTSGDGEQAAAEDPAPAHERVESPAPQDTTLPQDAVIPSPSNLSGLSVLQGRAQSSLVRPAAVRPEESVTPSPTRIGPCEASSSDSEQRAVLSPTSLQLLAASRVSPLTVLQPVRWSPATQPHQPQAVVPQLAMGHTVPPAAVLNGSSNRGFSRVSTNSRFIRIDDPRRANERDGADAMSNGSSYDVTDAARVLHQQPPPVPVLPHRSSDASRAGKPALQKPDSNGSLCDGSVGSLEIDSVPASPRLGLKMSEKVRLFFREMKDRKTRGDTNESTSDASLSSLGRVESS